MVGGQVADGSAVYTDALASYDGPEAAYRHQVADHAIEYVSGAFTQMALRISGVS